MKPCPSSDELVAFHTGELTPARVGAVTEHVETCQQGEERLQFLDGVTDPLLAALRRGAGDSPAAVPAAGSEPPGFARGDSAHAIPLPSPSEPESYSFL